MRNRRNQTWLWPLMIMVALIGGCGNGNPVGVETASALFPPRVTGITIADEFGRELGTWMYPSGNGRAYPNPTRAGVGLSWWVLADSVDAAWVVRAMGPFETLEPTNETAGGAEIVRSQGGLICRLTVQYGKLNGVSARWDGMDAKGNATPSGFYRIYFREGDRVDWVDVLKAETCRDMPAGLNFMWRCN